MSNTFNDVTGDVEYGEIDGDLLPILKCKCGHHFIQWDFIISTDSKEGYRCPNCKKAYFFDYTIKIYEIGEE